MKRHHEVWLCTCVLLLSACGGPRREPEAAPVPVQAPAGDMESEASESVESESLGAPSGAPPAEPLPSSGQPRRGADEGADDGAGDGLFEDLHSTERELDTALGLSGPDCDLGRALRDQICDLAARICELGNDGEIAERCGQSRASCNRATARVRSACGE